MSAQEPVRPVPLVNESKHTSRFEIGELGGALKTAATGAAGVFLAQTQAQVSANRAKTTVELKALEIEAEKLRTPEERLVSLKHNLALAKQEQLRNQLN